MRTQFMSAVQARVRSANLHFLVYRQWPRDQKLHIFIL